MALAVLGDVAILIGVDASKPSDNATGSNGTQGRIYFATDTGKTYRDNGTTWTEVHAIDSVTAAALAAHLADTTAAHAASAIGFTPAGAIAATDAQAAIVELDTEKQPIDSDLTAIAALTPTNDDVMQRKGGVWTNRSIPQLKTDLALNPLTTQDDIYIGGASGVPDRLAKGTDGQVLTIDPTTHHLIWATPSSGFANPMTTAGDIILGGSAGTPGRLAKGSDSQVLTVDPTTHLPLWATPSGGGGGGAADVILDYTEATDLFTNAAVTIDTWTQLVANKSFTIAASGRIQVNILGTFQVTTTGGSTTIAGARAIIDSGGTPITRHLNSMQGNSGGVFLGFAGSFALEGLATGAHTIKIEFRATGAGTKNLYLRASTDQYEHFHVDVIELP